MNRDDNRKKLNSDQRGFSLVEVVLAMAILTLISMPLLNYFMESMRYSALMARRQKATILAQELTESMKAEAQLVQSVNVGGTAEYQVPFLTGLGLTRDIAFPDDGRGTAEYSGTYAYTNGNFDLHVVVDTNVPANYLPRPLTYGVDEGTDTFAVERDQHIEAAAYFLAINHGSGGATMTQAQVEANMSREIHISLDYDTSANNFLLKVYYIYQCADLRSPGSVDSFTGTYLLDMRQDTLKNIYILYDCSYNQDDILLDISSDAQLHLPLFVDDGSPVNLGLFLIPQSAGTIVPGYKINVNSSWAEGVISAHVHSDVSVANVTLNPPGYVKPLATSGTTISLVSITTEVYENGHSSGDAPLATVTATKGE